MHGSILKMVIERSEEPQRHSSGTTVRVSTANLSSQERENMFDFFGNNDPAAAEEGHVPEENLAAVLEEIESGLSFSSNEEQIQQHERALTGPATGEHVPSGVHGEILDDRL